VSLGTLAGSALASTGKLHAAATPATTATQRHPIRKPCAGSTP
jgi:hypothetical protein